MNNILVISDNNFDFELLKKIPFKESNIYLATDSANDHSLAKNHESITECLFIQQMVPFTENLDTFLLIIDSINKNLKKSNLLAKFFNSSDIEWSYHVEGGFNVKIQSLLIKNTILENIINKYNITHVYFNKNNYDKDYFLLAQKKNIKIINSTLSLKNNNFKSIIQSFYFLYKDFVNSFHRKPEFISNKIVLFQLMGSAKKHTEHLKNVISNFNNSSLSTVTFAWRTDFDYFKKNIGSPYIKLESFLTLFDFLNSFLKILLLTIFYPIIINNLKSHLKIKHHDLNLSSFLASYTISSLYTDSINSFRFGNAFKRLVNYVKPKAVQVVGMPALMSGRKIADNLDKNTIKFNYLTMMTRNKVLADYNFKKYKNFYQDFILFIRNNIDYYTHSKRDYLEKHNIIRYTDNMKSVKKKTQETRELLKNKLDIRSSYDHYIFFDFPYLLMGNKPIEESFIVINILKEFLTKNPNIAVLIKPHPSSDENLLHLSGINTNSNCYVYSKDNSPEDILSLSDLTITKYSTIGIESMLHDNIVLSYNFMNVQEFKVYGEAAHYCYSATELQYLLNDIFKSDLSFLNYKEESIQNNDAFLEDFYPKEITDYKTIAFEIEKRLNEKT